MAFFFTGYINTDCAARLVVDVLKSQAFVLRTYHLIRPDIMGEHFRAISASSLVLGPP